MVGADEERIETERLILRTHRAEDIDAYQPLWTAAPGERMFTPVLDAEGAWARLLRLIGHREVFGWAPFLVEERGSGRIVGEAGFARFRRSVGQGFDEAPEAMWILSRETRGTGYGREATAAAFAWFDRRMPGTRSVAMIDPANAASLRLAEIHGFTAYGRTHRHDTDLVLFERVLRTPR